MPEYKGKHYKYTKAGKAEMKRDKAKSKPRAARKNPKRPRRKK